MRRVCSTVLFASALALSWPALAQTTGTQATTPGAGPQRDQQQLCDGKPCEDPAQQQDMQRLHSQDMDWLDNYGPAAGGGPGDAQKRGPHGPQQGGQGPGGPQGQGSPQGQGQGQGPR